MPKLGDIPKKKFVLKERRSWLNEDPSENINPINEIINTKEIQNSNNTQIQPKTKDFITSPYKIKKEPNPDLKSTTFNESPNNKNTIGRQLDNNSTTEETIDTLVGNERQLIHFIYALCRNAGEKTTPPLVIKDFLDSTTIQSKYVLKKTIERLIDKNVLFRLKGRRGKGGYMKFQLPDLVYNRLTIKMPEKRQIDEIWTTQTNKETTDIISTEPSNSEKLPQEWLDIDTADIQSHGVKFGIPQLKEIFELGTASTEAVQTLLDTVVFQIEQDKKTGSNKIKSPLGLIMSLLKKGREYIVEGYESPIEKTLKESLEKEKLKEQNINKMLIDLKETSFNNWYTDLDDAFIKTHIPNYTPDKKYLLLTEKAMKTFFSETIFPTIKAKIMRGETL